MTHPNVQDAAQAPMAWADVRKRRKGVKTLSVPVVLDFEALEELLVLQDELAKAMDRDARSNAPDEAPAILRRIDELEQQVNSSIHHFKLRSIGSAWDALIGEHPPSDEQRRAGQRWGDGFRKDAVVACLVDPVISDDAEADDLWESLDKGTRDLLFHTALNANEGAATGVPLARVVSEARRRYGGTSTTAPRGESRTASS